MPKAKIYTRQDILKAMKHTKSIRAAARYLGASYRHVKIYFKMYRLDENDPNSPTLFETHINQTGKGIPKFLPNRRKEPNVKKIFFEGTGWESFTPEKIKIRGIAEGYLKNECYICGFNEYRVTDYKVPLLLHFRDKNKLNYLMDNLDLLCYNCYFLYEADPLTTEQVRNIESNQDTAVKPYNWEITEKSMVDEIDKLDDEMLENMRSLGINID
jgi:hypothetical protein